MFPTNTIVENVVNSADHTTLVAAVKAAGLVDTLQGSGPFTVFAPTNSAFGKLPAGTVDTLLKPENKDALIKVLTYHVVARRMSAMDLRKAIKAGKGKAELITVSGGKLWATTKGNMIELKDSPTNMPPGEDRAGSVVRRIPPFLRSSFFPKAAPRMSLRPGKFPVNRVITRTLP